MRKREPKRTPVILAKRKKSERLVRPARSAAEFVSLSSRANRQHLMGARYAANHALPSTPPPLT